MHNIRDLWPSELNREHKSPTTNQVISSGKTYLTHHEFAHSLSRVCRLSENNFNETEKVIFS